MKKNKKIAIIIGMIIILIIIIFMCTMLLTTNNQHKYKNRISRICDDISENIKTKENFLIFVNLEETSLESENTINELIANYKKTSIIYTIDSDELENNCVKKIFAGTDFYENLLENRIPIAILYKDGKYESAIAGLDNYKTTEAYLDEHEVIEKKEIKEEYKAEEYTKKAEKNDNYLILIMADEKKRTQYEELLKKHFSDYNYDIVNLNSETGDKVREEIEKKYGTINEYPRVSYFENGKLIQTWEGSTEYDLTYFKDLIENKSN